MHSIQNKNLILTIGIGLSVISTGFILKGNKAASATPDHEEAHTALIVQEDACASCHRAITPGIVAQWASSTHAEAGIGCFECHLAVPGEADSYNHNGNSIATIVTPKDCARCHPGVADEFDGSHHAKGGNILASLDNFLAETVEGARFPFNPHSPTPGRPFEQADGYASVNLGCKQCHGSKVAFMGQDGGSITVDDLQPGRDNMPTNREAVAQIVRDESGKPLFDSDTWPNTGIGRINLDGSRGSCTACHSRHDFSRRRARQPENCGKCHLGPDHPQKEIYEESKHGIAYRDLKDDMNMDSPQWVLGQDYSQAPTCATCHMSGNIQNGGIITHDPGERISWTNRPPVSLVMDTDVNHAVITAADPVERSSQIADTATQKRERMQEVCQHCHSPGFVDGFYSQYDDFVILYNEKFAKPGQLIISALRENNLITDIQFDEEIEWTWFYLWHHEGRRARHGASMMAPDYTHWHGMYEVAERFYMGLIPQTREILNHAAETGLTEEAAKVSELVNSILSRPEHTWIGKQ